MLRVRRGVVQLLVVGFLALTLFLPPYGVRGAPAVEEWQKTLIIAVVGEPNTFDPAVSTSEISAYRYYPSIYESLIEYAPDGRLKPMLAEKWEVLDGGLKYRFYLVNNVKFSDGTAFDAEAVKFAFERLLRIGKGFVIGFEPIKSVEPVDRFTVDFVLKRPYAPFLGIMASWYGGIFVSPAVVKARETNKDLAEAWLHNHSAGTGPYVLESWIPENRIVLARNPHYRLGWKPGQIERVVYNVVREPATMRQGLAGGEIDMAAEGIPPSLIRPLKNTQGVVVRSELSHSHYGQVLYVNHSKPPFNNVNVRKALAYAINYDRLVAVWEGTATKADGPFPPTFKPWYADKALVKYVYSPDKAREYLAKAGMSVPISPPLRLDIIWRSGETAERDMGQLIVEDWAKLGIQPNLVENPRPVWREAIWKSTFDVAFILIPLRFNDPDALASAFFHSLEVRYRGWNPGFKDPRVDRLIELGRETVERTKRAVYYAELQNLVTDNVLNIPLVNRLDTFAYRRHLEGVGWNPIYGPHFNAYLMRKNPSAR